MKVLGRAIGAEGTPTSCSGIVVETSVAAEVNREDLHHWVRVPLRALGGGVGMLVVDSPRARDFVVNRLRVAGPLGSVVLPLHDAAGADPRRLARGVGDVVPELLRILEPDALGERLPFLQELAMNQHPILGLLRRAFFGPPSGNIWSYAPGAGSVSLRGTYLFEGAFW